MRKLILFIIIILLTSCSVFFKTNNKTLVQETISTIMVDNVNGILPLLRNQLLYDRRKDVISNIKHFVQVDRSNENQDEVKPINQTVILRVKDTDGSILYESELPINE